MLRRQQTRASLLSLPSELIDGILSYFTASRDFEAGWWMHLTPDGTNRKAQNERGRATLYKLCLVSKDIHAHAEPALYSWVVINVGWRDVEQLCAFVFRFSKCPALATKLKYVESQELGVNDPDYMQRRHSSLLALEGGKVYRAIEDIAEKVLGPEAASQWNCFFKTNVTMALGALIMQLSPGIQHISISAMDHIPQTISYLFGAFPSASGHVFSKLQVLCFDFFHTTETDAPSTLGRFMQSLLPLAQLRHLKMDCDHCSLSDISQPQNFNFPSLRTLILEDFGDTPTTLAAIVESCYDLETLECSLSSSKSFPGGNALSADLSALELALVKHQSTLKTLMFRLDVHRPRGLAIPLSTLAQFGKLTTLTIDTVSLLGKPWSPGAPAAETTWWSENTPFRLSERLPPQLAELTLYDYHEFEDNVPILRDLADDCGIFSRLTLVIVHHIYDPTVSWPKLEDRFRGKGVTML